MKDRNSVSSSLLAAKIFALIPELERALTELGCKVEVIRFPHFWVITTERINSLKAFLQQRSANQFLIFCPDSTELFLEKPDFTLAYSAYRGRYNCDYASSRTCGALSKRPLTTATWYGIASLRSSRLYGYLARNISARAGSFGLPQNRSGTGF